MSLRNIIICADVSLFCCVAFAACVAKLLHLFSNSAGTLSLLRATAVNLATKCAPAKKET